MSEVNTPHGGSSIKNSSIDLDINVNREQLDDTIEELRELKDTKPNITIRNNETVNVTINNFNETEKEWSQSIDAHIPRID